MKNKVAIICILFIVAGFALMTFWNEVFIVGLGILIATYFYGVAQPYYYNKLSVASSRIALTLTLAWFASMDSIGNVVAPFIIDGIAKVFHTSTQTHPIVAFRICLWMTVIAAALVIVRKIYVEIRNKSHEDHDEKVAVAAAKPAVAAKAADAAKAVAAETVKPAEDAKPVEAAKPADPAKAATETVKNVVDDKAKASSETTDTK